MAAKRQATTKLTHDNWDEEDPVEEPGHFEKASNDIIEKREIKVAKRRNLRTGGSEKTLSFQGLNWGTSASVEKPSFSFKSLAPTTSSATTNGAEKPIFSSIVASTDTGKNDRSTNVHFLADVKLLNETMISWIQKYYAENPYVDFKPVFADYSVHMGSLVDKHKVNLPQTSHDTTITSSNVPLTSQDTKASNTRFAFSSISSNIPNTSSSIVVSSVPSTTVVSTSITPPMFNFGSSSPMGKSASLFKFGSSQETSESPVVCSEKGSEKEVEQKETTDEDTQKSPNVFQVTSGFSFSNMSGIKFPSTTSPFGGSALFPSVKPSFPLFGGASVEKNSQEEGGDENDEPPKVEVAEVVEEGAVISKRCRLFYQEAKAWKEKGVGMLHLKKLDDGKCQLIVRADTNLGNILLNIMLTEDIPVKAKGKKDISFLCIPNPPLNPKAVEPETKPSMMLLRFKESIDMEEALGAIEKHKGGL